MNIIKFLFQRVVLLAVVVFGMVACSGSDPAPGTTGATGTLSGTAATGKAIASAQITIKGANNVTVTVDTDTSGKYTRDVSTLTAPYLLRVPDPLNANSYLFSVANVSGTANIHPFTDLIIRNWYKVKGADVETQFTGTLDATKLPTVDGINTIAAVIKSILKTSFENAGVPADFNLMSGSFDADQTGFDKVLDQTRVVIAADGVVNIEAVNPITGAAGARSILATTTISTNLAPAIPVVDDIAPTDPSGLAALPAGTTSMVLFWNASTDAVGVAGYNIYRGVTAGAISTTKIASSPFPGFSDTGLTSGSQYCYQVEAFDLAGNLSAIIPVPATCATTSTVVDTTPPAAPTSLVATASTTQGRIDLNWVASTSTDTIAYDIYRDGVVITTTAGTIYNDTGLAANTLYSYTIKARDAAGNASAVSNISQATTAAGIPSAPINVQAVAGNQQVTISWSPVSGATAYNLYMDTVSGISKTTVTPGVMHHPSVSSPFVHPATLVNGTPYFFVVTAVNASGEESIESAQVQATPTAPPIIPPVTLADIQAQFDVFNGLFATSLPVATNPTLAALFAPDFLWGGTGKADFLIDITDPAFDTLGLAFTAQALVAPPRDSGAVANDATHQWVTVTCSDCNGEVFKWLAIKEVASGKWQLAGDQRKVGVGVFAQASRNTFNGTVNMSSFVEIFSYSPAITFLAAGVNSVTVSGPGLVNAAGNAGSATLFNSTQATSSFESINECSAFVATNCFNYANLAAGDYTFTVRGIFNSVAFVDTYVETLSGIPPATANLTAAMFPVINTTPTLASLVPNATVTANWTLPVGYTPVGSFLSSFNNIMIFDASGVNSVSGSSVTSTFTLPPVFNGTGAVTNTSICVASLSANGASFETCVDIAPAFTPIPTPTVTLTATSSSIASGATSTLSWSSTNSMFCTLSGSVGAVGITGTFTTPPLTVTSTYTVTCTGAGDSGSASQSVTVTVAAALAQFSGVAGGCVQDNVTGLMWEVKTADGGLRDWNKAYTNYDSTLSVQKFDGFGYVVPIQADIDAQSNSVGFKNAVNATNLCGFSDWRLPTVGELQSIVRSGFPTIDHTWFPNTQSNGFWSASPVVGSSTVTVRASLVYFNGGNVSDDFRDVSHLVRLVRAGQ